MACTSRQDISFESTAKGFVNGQIIKLWDAGYAYCNELEDEERDQMSGRLKIKFFISGRGPLNEYIIVEFLAGDAGGGVHVHNMSRYCTNFMRKKNRS